MATNNQLKGQLDWVENMGSPLLLLDAATSFAKGRTIIRANDSSTTAVDVGIAGGAVRLPMGGDDADTAQMYGPLAFEPDESPTMWMQTRFRISDVSVASVFIGFTDQNSVSEMPIEDEGGALGPDTPAADAFGILLEGEQDGTWQTVGVQNGTDNAQAASTNIDDLADSEWTTVKVECSPADSGSMRVWVDGVQLVTANTTSTKSFGNNVTTNFLRSSIVFAPVAAADDRNSAYNLDISEFGWSGSVGAGVD